MRFLPLLLLLCACSSGETAAPSRHEKIAGAFCECTANLAALNHQAQPMSKPTPEQEAEMLQLIRTIQEEYERAKECAASLVAQYGKQNAADLDLIRKAMEKYATHLREQQDLLPELLGQ